MCCIACLSPIWLGYFLKGDVAKDLGLVLAICGPFVMLISYVWNRDSFLGVVIHSAGRAFRYVVSKKRLPQFLGEFKDLDQ